MRYKCDYCKQIWQEQDLDGEMICPDCYDTVHLYSKDEQEQDEQNQYGEQEQDEYEEENYYEDNEQEDQNYY